MDKERGEQLEGMQKDRNLFYLKEGKAIPTKSALNVALLEEKDVEYLDRVVAVVSKTICEVLPQLYQSAILDAVFPEFNKEFEGVNKSWGNYGSNIGIDCIYDAENSSLKIFEINCNAVVSLGYMDPMIQVYQELFQDELPDGTFRPITPLLSDEMGISNDSHVIILGADESKTYYEELNQVALLENFSGANVERMTTRELNSQIDKSDPKLIKRAVSGSILARFDNEWELLKRLENSDIPITNPLIGLAYGSKVSLFLLKSEENYSDIKKYTER